MNEQRCRKTDQNTSEKMTKPCTVSRQCYLCGFGFVKDEIRAHFDSIHPEYPSYTADSVNEYRAIYWTTAPTGGHLMWSHLPPDRRVIDADFVEIMDHVTKRWFQGWQHGGEVKNLKPAKHDFPRNCRPKDNESDTDSSWPESDSDATTLSDTD